MEGEGLDWQLHPLNEQPDDIGEEQLHANDGEIEDGNGEAEGGDNRRNDRPNSEDVEDPFRMDPAQEDDILVDEEERRFLELLMGLGLRNAGQQPGDRMRNHSSLQEFVPYPTFSKIVRSEFYDGAAETFGVGPTFKEKFVEDQYANLREETDNIYYPMASFSEWEFTNVLLRLPVSQNWKNELLKTQLVGYPVISTPIKELTFRTSFEILH